MCVVIKPIDWGMERFIKFEKSLMKVFKEIVQKTCIFSNFCMIWDVLMGFDKNVVLIKCARRQELIDWSTQCSMKYEGKWNME